MPWNSTWPVGSISVKANRPLGQQNTTYIETTMGKSPIGTNTVTTRDHFWAVGTNEDGRHRFIQSPAFTVGGNAADPLIGTGMDSVFYARTINGQVQWFNRNALRVFQATPNVLTGSVVVSSSSSYATIIDVPNNTYGEIFMYCTDSDTSIFTIQSGIFKARGGTCQAYSLKYEGQGSGSSVNALKLGNGGEADNLNIRARRADASSSLTNWNYIITYRSL